MYCFLIVLKLSGLINHVHAALFLEVHFQKNLRHFRLRYFPLVFFFIFLLPVPRCVVRVYHALLFKHLSVCLSVRQRVVLALQYEHFLTNFLHIVLNCLVEGIGLGLRGGII